MNKPGEVKALDTEDLEPIGEGGNSRVFRLDGNKVVKVFHKGVSCIPKAPIPHG